MRPQTLGMFTFQCKTWGYALSGDVAEITALVSENPTFASGVILAWDKTEADRQRTIIGKGDEPDRPMRYWGCLPWVAEQFLRTGAPWPGL